MAAGTAHPIPELDASGLRRFGVTTSLVVAALFGLLLPLVAGAELPWWPWALSGALAAWGLLAPGSLRPVYRGWMRFGLLMSRVTTPLVLGLVFVLLVTPFALLRGALGRDSLARKLDPKAESYRVPSRRASAENLERPY